MTIVLRRPVALAIAALLIAGCQDSSTVIESKNLKSGEAMMTSANVRTINRYKVVRSESSGLIDPQYVTCAEPSPDVANAMATAFGAGGSLGISGLPSGVDPKVAAAISASRAESMAQLGERLATIQLLRDGLYRACEAYANGAISSTTYAVMVSRYDDTMVTMLASELAAGAFGRSLAGLQSGSGGSAEASADFLEKREEIRRAERSLKRRESESSSLKTALKKSEAREESIESQLREAKDERRELRDALKSAETTGAAAGSGADSASSESSSEKIEALKTELDRSNKEVSKLQSQLEESKEETRSIESQLEESEKQEEEAREELATKLTTEAASRAQATAIVAGGITPGQQKPGIAQEIGRIQRKFIENINTDAIEIACVSALDRYRPGIDSHPTALMSFCDEKLMALLLSHKKALYLATVQRAQEIADYEEARADGMKALTDIRKYLDRESGLPTNITDIKNNAATPVTE